MTISTANINSLWSSLLIEELVRHGVDYFSVSPGSRSTPLTVAVARNPGARAIVHFDERGAAFHALGYARATGKPAALICTSGTAVANYLPAVVEASLDRIPIILLTADRPPELRNTGANQTITQPGIYGGYVRWELDLTCPERTISPEVALTAADDAVFAACRVPEGPVHLNCMFREPLAPISNGEDFGAYLSGISSWANSDRPFAECSNSQHDLAGPLPPQVGQIVQSTQRGILLVGELRSNEQREAVFALGARLNWPIFPDIASGLRLGCISDRLVPYYNLALSSATIKDLLTPSAVLHIGGRITSKRTLDWLEQAPIEQYVHVTDNPMPLDPIHRVTNRVESDIPRSCTALADQIGGHPANEYGAQWKAISTAIDRTIDDLLMSESLVCETAIARSLSRLIDPGSALFLASSMPIRDMDIFAATDGSSVPVACNRGASGIDGTVASAAGYAVGCGKPVTLLIGDLALLHDLNSLAMLQQIVPGVTVVIINNYGGGIFDHLPIAEFTDVHRRYFVAEHDLTFEHAAAQFNLPYRHPTSLPQFVECYRNASASGRSSIIELTVDREQNMMFHRRLIQAVDSTFRECVNKL